MAKVNRLFEVQGKIERHAYKHHLFTNKRRSQLVALSNKLGDMRMAEVGKLVEKRVKGRRVNWRKK